MDTGESAKEQLIPFAGGRQKENSKIMVRIDDLLNVQSGGDERAPLRIYKVHMGSSLCSLRYLVLLAFSCKPSRMNGRG